MNFRWEKISALKNLIMDKIPEEKNVSPELIKTQKNIVLQIALAALTIILTIVILFAMTSAWYTNIVQTSGLVFEVETWGLEGQILVEENVKEKIAPGKNGNINLIAENKSEGITTVDINVSKKAMHEDMKKRLFFYVDAPETYSFEDENGEITTETVDRVYVNEKEAYTYTLFGKDSLFLTEDITNAPELKWHWVYDVLGYYVLAQENETGLTVLEYLRPIEYDYDKATFAAVEENGNNVIRLETVDGKTSPKDFLAAFSKNDGYAGSIDTSENVSGGFYKVSVDENGYGVYAYLCSYADIYMETQTDARLAESAALENPPTFTAEITISAQSGEEITRTVTNLAELEEAMANGEPIILGTDMAFGTLTVPEGTNLVVDLGGNKITAETILAKEGSSVTMMNGTLESAETGKGKALDAFGAEITLSNVKITGFDRGINVRDNDSPNDGDSTVRVSGCEIDGVLCAIFLSGNGTDSEQKTQLIVENSILKSPGYGIVGNGSSNRVGTDIRVINCTIESTGTESNGGKWGTGIYHPQNDSDLTIYNSKISGIIGITIKGGNTEIINSQIFGKGEAADPVASASGSGVNGDAIYIENNYEGNSIDLVIRETEAEINNSGEEELLKTVIKSDEDHAIRVYDKNMSIVKVTVRIHKGEFFGLGMPFGTEWIASGSTQHTNGSNHFGVVPEVPVTEETDE